MRDDAPDYWVLPTFRSLTVRPLLAGLPPEWAVALGAMWWALYIVSAHIIGCLIGAFVSWLSIALLLRHDPHGIEVLRRSLQLRRLLES